MRLLIATAGMSTLATLALAGCASQSAPQPESAVVDYSCDNGQTIQAQYFPPDGARVMIDDHSIDMHIARSADGARYVGGERVWWTKGSGPGSHGTLFAYEADTGTTGDRIAFCEQTSD